MARSFFTSLRTRRLEREAPGSISQLAREIAALWREHDALEKARVSSRPDESALLARQSALEDRVATMRAGNLAEGAIQAALALGAVEFAEGETEGMTAKQIRKAKWLLESILLMLIRESGIEPSRYGLDRYARHLLH